MATIREYFDSDCKTFTIHNDWRLRSSASIIQIRVKIAWDFEGNAKYWYLFVPGAVSRNDVPACITSLLSTPEIEKCVLHGDGDTIHANMGFSGYSENATSDSLVFTRRVLVYVDADLSESARREITRHAEREGFYLIIRDRDYARTRSEHEKPIAFISHDSRDKEEVVRPLALELIKHQCPVWYDEFSLMVGDSLRASIEKGLKEAKKCIIVLSPYFLSNTGWSKAEYDSIFTREMIEERDVILPVWHQVSKEEVYEFSPRLADKFGLQSTLGAEKLASKLVDAIRAS